MISALFSLEILGIDLFSMNSGSTSVIRIVCGTTHMNMPVQNRIKSIALKLLRVVEVCAKPDGAFKVVVQMSTKKLKIEEAECR